MQCGDPALPLRSSHSGGDSRQESKDGHARGAPHRLEGFRKGCGGDTGGKTVEMDGTGRKLWKAGACGTWGMYHWWWYSKQF